MRFITGALAAIGLAVVLTLVVAVGVFAYENASGQIVGDVLAQERPTGGATGERAVREPAQQ